MDRTRRKELDAKADAIVGKFLSNLTTIGLFQCHLCNWNAYISHHKGDSIERAFRYVVEHAEKFHPEIKSKP